MVSNAGTSPGRWRIFSTKRRARLTTVGRGSGESAATALTKRSIDGK